MTWETYNKFPIVYQKWLIERISKEISKASDNNQQPPTKAPHQNNDEVRSLMGNQADMHRTTAPRMQRFR